MMGKWLLPLLYLMVGAGTARGLSVEKPKKCHAVSLVGFAGEVALWPTVLPAVQIAGVEDRCGQ